MPTPIPARRPPLREADTSSVPGQAGPLSLQTPASPIYCRSDIWLSVGAPAVVALARECFSVPQSGSRQRLCEVLCVHIVRDCDAAIQSANRWYNMATE